MTVRASNGVALGVIYDSRLNIRPWTHTIFIRTKSGYLRAGHRMIVVFGERSGGSRGLRMQTNVEETFEFHTLVDALATTSSCSCRAHPRSPSWPGHPAHIRHHRLPHAVACGGTPSRTRRDIRTGSAIFPDAVAVVGTVAQMENIVRTAAATIRFDIDAVGSALIERLDVFNGTEHWRGSVDTTTSPAPDGYVFFGKVRSTAAAAGRQSGMAARRCMEITSNRWRR